MKQAIMSDLEKVCERFKLEMKMIGIDEDGTKRYHVSSKDVGVIGPLQFCYEHVIRLYPSWRIKHLKRIGEIS